MPDVLQEAQQRVEARARAKRDKLFLANEVLGYDFSWETHAELFACFIKYDPTKPWVEQDSVKDRMVLWPRGHYKTTAIIVEIIQAILNNPNIRILIMQGSIKVTKTLLHQIRSHFTGQAEGSRLRELFPEFCGDTKDLGPNPAVQFTTPARTAKQLAQATVTVASTKSIKTGQHYDMGFFDDLVTDQNFRSPTQLEKVRADFTLAQPLIDPGCYRFVTGTRYAFGDLYEEILRWNAKDGKWLVSIKDCWTDDTRRLPDEQKRPRFPQHKKKNGEIGGFTTEYLLQLQRDDLANFANQYLNCPIHTSQQVYTKDLLWSAVIPAQASGVLSQPIMMIDLATGDSATADDSVIQIGAVDTAGIGYVCDMRGGQWVPMELAVHVIDMALRHRPLKVFVEKSAAGQVFADYLKLVAQQKHIYLPIEFAKVDNRPDAKNMRVVALAGVIKKGRFKFFAGLSKFESLVEQAITFPKGRHGHDDYIDTAALLYGELIKELLALPVRSAPKNSILAMIAERENALVKVLTHEERTAVEHPDTTGLD